MGFKALGDLLQAPKNFSKEKGQKGHFAESFDFLTLIKQWEEIVGPRLAKYTIPLKNQKKILTILSYHSSYSQQLSFMERQLVEKIIESFPQLKNKIDRIKFIVNTSYFEQQKVIMNKKIGHQSTSEPTLHPQSPQYKTLKKEADSLLEEVHDNELKETLTSLYLQSRKN